MVIQHGLQLRHRESAHGADGMAMLRQCFQQRQLQHIMVAVKPLPALGLWRGNHAISTLPHPQGCHGHSA